MIGSLRRLKEALHFLPLLKSSYIIITLAVLFVGGLLLDHDQTNFGKAYAEELTKERNDLRLHSLDFRGDVSYSEFRLRDDSERSERTAEEINAIGETVRSVYCRVFRMQQKNLKLKLFHVNVVLVEDGYRNVLLSRSLSEKTCT